MARASVYTHLPLDTWAKILGMSPWEFNQMVYPGAKTAQCKDVFYQFQWQKDHLGREEVAQAIADAEQMIADELMYWPAPHYIVGEVAQYPRPHQRQLFGYAGTPRGEWKTVQLNWHRVESGGVFNRTSIGTILAADITKLDLDSDTIFESFTATITDPAIADITDPNELGLYFATADRHGEAIGEIWRLRPLTVTISGTTATFAGHRTLLVKPDPEFAVEPAELDAKTDTNYVDTLECYRAFTDTTATSALPYQGVAIWKDIPGCSSGCTFSLKELCLGENDNENGSVFAAFGDPCTWPFADREPDRLEVNYIAGLPLVNGQMQPEMARCVAYLSASMLANEKCGCDRTNRILAYWKQRITTFEDQTNKAQGFSKDYTSIPFPVTRGGLFAWQRVKRWRDVGVVSA